MIHIGRSVLMAGMAALLICGASTVAAAPAGKELKDLQGLGRHAGGNGFAPAPAISLEQATSIARREVGGRVLSANPRHRAGAIEYRVRMLVDGERVVTVTVDGAGRLSRNR